MTATERHDGEATTPMGWAPPRLVALGGADSAEAKVVDTFEFQIASPPLAFGPS